MQSAAPGTPPASSTSRSAELAGPPVLDGPEAADEAARAGQRDVAVRLHGARPDVHDWVAGTDGAYREAIATLTAARSHGLHVTAITTVTRSNHRVLAELPRLLRARGVRRWILELPGGPLDTSVHPRIGLAVPSALAAMEQARTLGLEARLRGAPLCAMGRFSARAAPSPARSFAPRCDGCAARERCPGVAADYLARFGPSELRPLTGGG